jgi:hypothetical protein
VEQLNSLDQSTTPRLIRLMLVGMKSRPLVPIVLQCIVFTAGIAMIVISAINVMRPDADGRDWALLAAGAVVAVSALGIGGTHVWVWRRERREFDEIVARNADENR